jgi:hypothetical protein
MCLFLLRTQTNMSSIIVGNGGRGSAATAITVALILMASPAILTTEAFAAPISNKDCKDIQFRALESSSYSTKAGNTITIGTSQDEYSVKIDYFKDSGDEVLYFKNVAAKDPRGRVLLPGGETMTITLQTNESISNGYRTSVTLYNDKVCDYETFRGINVKDTDKMALEIVSIEQTDESPIVKVTVRVPDASDVDKHLTKLNVQFPYSPEAQEYYLISHRVQVS